MFQKMIESLQRVRLTEIEYVLLKALIYCYSACTDLSDYARKTLHEESNKYARILLKYLQLEYGNSHGAQKYAQIVALMDVFFNFGERQKNAFLLQMINFEKEKAQSPIKSFLIDQASVLEEMLY